MRRWCLPAWVTPCWFSPWSRTNIKVAVRRLLCFSSNRPFIWILYRWGGLGFKLSVLSFSLDLIAVLLFKVAITRLPGKKTKPREGKKSRFHLIMSLSSFDFYLVCSSFEYFFYKRKGLGCNSVPPDFDSGLRRIPTARVEVDHFLSRDAALGVLLLLFPRYPHSFAILLSFFRSAQVVIIYTFQESKI